MPGRTRAAWLVIGLAAQLPAGAPAQRLGVFFDEQGTSCSASIEPFLCGEENEPHRRVHIVAFSDSVLAGVQFRVELPPDLEICTDHGRNGLIWPRMSRDTVTGDLATGMDVQFFDCLPPGQSTLIVSFDLWARRAGTDFVLHLAGAAQDTLSDQLFPNLKICDPDDPEGNRGIVDATPSDAYLNCEALPCRCTSAVERRTWAHVKTLYKAR